MSEAMNFSMVRAGLLGIRAVKTSNPEAFETKLDKLIAPRDSKIGAIPNPMSDDINYDFDKLDSEVARNVESADFWTFAKKYIPPVVSWGRTLSVDQVLSFSKSMDTCILHLPEEIQHMGMKNFARITHILTESLTKAQVIDETKKMIKIGIRSSPKLRDEMYFQIIKQVRNNVNPESVLQGWVILSSYAVYFPPSDKATHPILNYLKFIAEEHNDTTIQSWARYAFSRLVIGYLGGGRAVLASNFELEYLRDQTKIPFTINFPNGGMIELFIENYQTFGDLKDVVMAQMGIDVASRMMYGFMEECCRPDRIDECYIEEFVNVCDLVSSWEHESHFYKKVLGGTPYNATFRVFFKLKHFYEIPGESNEKLNFFFNEAMYLFKGLHFDPSIEDLMQLCSLDLQVRLGDHDGETETYIINSYFDKIPNFPCKYGNLKEEKVIEMLSKKYTEMIGMKRNEAKQKFVDLVTESGMLGYCFYACKFAESENCDVNLTPRVIIGVREDGLKIFDTNYLELMTLEFKNIFKWGYSETTFVLLYGDQNYPSKLVFKTYQGTAVAHTITSFVNLKLGLNPKPNLLTQANMRQTNREKVFFKRVSIFRQAQNPEKENL